MVPIEEKAHKNLKTLTIQNNPQLLEMMVRDDTIEIVSLSTLYEGKRHHLSYRLKD